MMLRRCVLGIVLLTGTGLLAGCGAVSGTGGSTQTGTAANLGGNWLLAGTLPSVGIAQPSPVPLGLAATFDASGSNVTGILTMQFPCPGTGFTNPPLAIVNGPVASDGSFTLQTPSVSQGTTVTVKGNAPVTANGNWTGSYSVVSPNCGVFAGQITATSMPLVTGTFSGSMTLLTAPPIPVTVTTNLQQGGTLPNGSTTYSNALLSGTISIVGSSCLTSGTTVGTATTQGAVEGNTVLASFLMNDGSTLEMLGGIASPDSKKLQVGFITTGNGSCNTTTLLASSALLVKQ